MHFPLSFCKNASPYFFHVAFAPSFIWSRRPWCNQSKPYTGCETCYRHIKAEASTRLLAQYVFHLYTPWKNRQMTRPGFELNPCSVAV